MIGTLICNKCKRRMVSPQCACGGSTPYVRFYWKGKYYERRRDGQGNTFTFKSAGMALTALNAAIENNSRIPFDPVHFLDASVKERLFENQIEGYYRDKKQEVDAQELSPEYFRIIYGYSRKYFTFFYGCDITEINLKKIVDFKRSLDVLPKIKSRKNILHALRAFFNWLYQNGRIPVVPPFPTVKGDNADKRRAVRKGAQLELIALLPEEDRDVFRFMMETGVRPGEVCAILVEACHPEERAVIIGRTLSGSTYRETTKENTKLPVPLNDTALEIVKRNMKGKFPKQFLFLNPRTGRGYKYKALYKAWVTATGNDIHLYEATRHSFCTQIVPLADRFTAQRLMRHADQRSTEGYYHEFSETLVNVVQRNDVVELKKVSANTTDIAQTFDNDSTENH